MENPSEQRRTDDTIFNKYLARVLAFIMVIILIPIFVWIAGSISSTKTNMVAVSVELKYVVKDIVDMKANITSALSNRYTSDDARIDNENDRHDLELINKKISILEARINRNDQDDAASHSRE